MQKILSDGREVFLLIEDEKENQFILHERMLENLPSINSQIDFLKIANLDNFNQYLSELCSYHNPLIEVEQTELQGHDWLVLSKEFGIFFPNKFHHPFVEDSYIISDAQKDDNGVVEEVTLVNMTDDQQTYTLTRDTAVSLEQFDEGREIEEYITYMEGFFNNQDTLCLSSL